MKQLFLGDFGTSWRTGNPVTFDLSSRWPATIELASIAMIIAILWAIPLGLISSIRKKSISDYIAKFLSGLGVAIPEFWLATLLILIFSNLTLFKNFSQLLHNIGLISFWLSSTSTSDSGNCIWFRAINKWY